jgi:hypothetical protein|tara:strand:+ start:559 stop:858 length:300 start_codon:yes stop_codon:yes gene_type:complete
MEVQGKVKLIGEIQKIGSKGFVKAELIVETDGEYPQPINIEFTGDNTDFLAKLSVGDLVKVFINLRGREWTSPEGVVKYFNSIQGWKVDVLESEEKEDF